VLTGEIMHECRHTLKTFSTCGYSTAAMVKWTRINVTL
jgi:hypothetical protein